MKRLILLVVFSMQAMDVELKPWAEIEEPLKFENTIELLVQQPKLFEERWGRLPANARRRIAYFLMKDHPIIELFDEAWKAKYTTDKGVEVPANHFYNLGPGVVSLFCFSPTRPKLLVVNTQGKRQKATVWDYSRFSYYTLEDYHSPITIAQFSLCGRYIFTGLQDGTVIRWSFNEGMRFNGHTQQVTCMSRSPNKKYLVTGSDDATARIWDIKTGELVYTLEHEDALTAVDWNPQGRVIVTSSRNGVVTLWDVSTGEAARLVAHTSPVHYVEWDTSGKRLLIVTTDEVMVEEGERKVFSLGCSATVAHFDRRGERIIISTSDGKALVYQVYPKLFLKAFPSKCQRAAQFVGEQDRIICWPDAKKVGVYSGVSYRPLFLLRPLLNYPVEAACLNGAGSRLAVGCKKGRALFSIYDVGDKGYYFMHEITSEQALLLVALGKIIKDLKEEETIELALPDHLQRKFDALRDEVKEMILSYVSKSEKSCVIA